MKLIQVKRKTKLENRFAPKMGRLNARVTYIKKQFLGIPIKLYINIERHIMVKLKTVKTVF